MGWQWQREKGEAEEKQTRKIDKKWIFRKIFSKIEKDKRESMETDNNEEDMINRK